jgi:hypothetical protein
VNQHRRVATAAIFIVNFQLIRIEKWHCVRLPAFRIYRGRTQGHNPTLIFLPGGCWSVFFQAHAPRARGHDLAALRNRNHRPILSHQSDPGRLESTAWQQERLRAECIRVCSFFCRVLRR